MTQTSHRSNPSPTGPQLVLILSHDALAAALLGGLVETLGYDVRFRRTAESPEDTLRRLRPRICLVDSGDPPVTREDFLGHATMRGVCVVIFGTREALERLREVAARYRIATLLMPPTIDELEYVLQQAASG